MASDHFEELGRPPRLLHGGFGLITVGGIAKPRYHALWLLAQLGDTELPVTATGDGADGLVQTWATRRDDGSLAVLVWCSTLDQAKRDGDPALARRVRVHLTGTAGRAEHGHPPRPRHGDVTTLAEQLGIGDWPTDDSGTNCAPSTTSSRTDVDMSAEGDASVIELDLPQPGAVLIEVAAG